MSDKVGKTVEQIMKEDVVWLPIILFFERMLKHDMGQDAVMGLIGAVKSFSVAANYSDDMATHLLANWASRHFAEQIKTMEFMETPKGKNEVMH